MAFCTTGEFIAARTNRRRSASFPCIQLHIAYKGYRGYASVHKITVI